MKREEFNAQMERLVKVYGQSKYPVERQDMIFKRVGKVEIKQFINQVDYFIGAFEKAPLASEFELAFASQLADLRKAEIEALEKVWRPCDTCNGTGHVTMYRKNTGWEYAFQCTCPRGEVLQPTFTKQYQGMGEEYASHKAWAHNKFDRNKAIMGANHIVGTG